MRGFRNISCISRAGFVPGVATLNFGIAETEAEGLVPLGSPFIVVLKQL